MTTQTPNNYMARLNSAFEALFNPQPITEDDVREHERLVMRQRARDEAGLRAPQQDALPL